MPYASNLETKSLREILSDKAYLGAGIEKCSPKSVGSKCFLNEDHRDFWPRWKWGWVAASNDGAVGPVCADETSLANGGCAM